MTRASPPEATDGSRALLSWLWPLAAWLVTRAFLVGVTVLDVGIYPAASAVLSDISVYEFWLGSLSNGATPTDDMWQYPPLAGLFFLVGLIGPDPGTALITAIVGVDLILTVVLLRQSRTAGWFWVWSGLAVGPVLIARFDVLPTLFAVLAVLAAGRPVATGAWSAVGAALKVWPVLMLAVIPRRDAVRAGASFLLTLAGLLFVTGLIFSGAGAFLTGQGSRGLQVESVAALPFLIARAFGADVELELRYGAVEVIAPGSGLAAGIAVAASLLLLAWLAWSWWRDRLSEHLPADVALTAVLFSVVSSRVFSPQFSIWLLGLGALSWAARKSRVRPSVLLVLAATLAAQFIYPWGYGALISGDRWAVAMQVLRIVLMVTATVLAARAVLLSGPDGQQVGARSAGQGSTTATGTGSRSTGPG